MTPLATSILTENILPYWLRLMDTENGGFYGRVMSDETLCPTADKGAILHARILWAFSAAYRVLRRPEYLTAATHAYRFLTERLLDPEYGGVYWALDYKGQPVDTKKQFYAIGFAIYGLSEYYRATATPEALDYAIRLYRDIEAHAWDATYGGYIEATTRDWQPIADMRLSDKDENTAKSQNTHLHIIEPYANLYRVWPDPQLREAILRLIDIFRERIQQPSGHMGLFFDEAWRCTSDAYSAGHDIEASWLIDEAASVINHQSSIINSPDSLILSLASAAREGLLPNGLMHGTWWEQAETVVGYLNLYQHFGDAEALAISRRCLIAIRDHYLDTEHGEWYWGADNSMPEEDKAGFWKCPYHNSRMCLEIIERGSEF